jgi:hypothetical protein
MGERPDWEATPAERARGEQGSPGEPPLRHDSPTLPGLPRQGTINVDPDFSTQPEWPVARPGGCFNTPSPQGPGYCFGVAIVGMLGMAFVLALVAGALFAVHIHGSSPLAGETGVSVSASQTAKVSTATTHPAQPSPTPNPTATPSATNTPTPVPPQLSVSPRQVTGRCLLGSYPNLTVQNTGGADLTWTAATSATSVQADPSSGTLAAAATQTVTLSGVYRGYTLTVTFSGNGGEATVTITCS